MKHPQIVQRVFEMQKKKIYFYEIHKYLKSQNLTVEEMEAAKTEANILYKQHKSEANIKMGKVVFGISLIVSIFLFYYFFFHLPKQNIVDFVGVISVLGSLTICFTLYLLLVFFPLRRHDKDSDGIPEPPVFHSGLLSLFLLFSIIPGIVFYFWISWRIEAGAEKTLAETAVATNGLVLSGTYSEGGGIRRKRPDHAEIKVKFITKDKKTIQRTIEVPTFQFKNFYKGQKVAVIYSSENYNNFKVLTGENSYKKYFKTQEREIVVDDLISFFGMSDAGILKELNSISYKWKFEKSQESWINTNRQCALNKKDGLVSYIPMQNKILIFDNDLNKKGFQKLTVDNTTVFENDSVTVLKSFVRDKNQSVCIYSVSKKAD